MRRTFHALQQVQSQPMMMAGAAQSWQAAVPAAAHRATTSAAAATHPAASRAMGMGGGVGVHPSAPSRHLHVSACSLAAPPPRRVGAQAVEAAKSSSLLSRVSSSPPSEVRGAVEQAWRDAQREAHRWTEPEVMVVLRRLSDAAALESRREESRAEEAAWLARATQTDYARQRRLKALWEHGVRFTDATTWARSTPREHWNTRHGLVRALIVLASRCQEYQSVVNLLAQCDHNGLVQLLKYGKSGKEGTSIDEPLVSALFQCLAHAPQPGPPAPSAPSSGGQGLLLEVLSFAPPGFDGSRNIAVNLLLMVLRHTRHQGMSLAVHSALLHHLSVLFAGMPDTRTLPSNFFAAQQHAAAFDLCWFDGVEDRASPAQQGRSLLEAFEHNVAVRVARGQWQDIPPLLAIFLPALEKRAQQARLPTIRSDIFNAILFVTARFHAERLATTFLQLRTMFPSFPAGRYGLDAHGWTLFLSAYLLQPFTHMPADVAELYDLAIASTPHHTHMPIINAYLLFLCDHSIETLQERWTRIRSVMAHAMRPVEPESTGRIGVVAAQTDNGADADAADVPALPLPPPAPLQPDLALFSTVIRFLDRMHTDQIPFSHFAEGTEHDSEVGAALLCHTPLALVINQAFLPLALLFPSPAPVVDDPAVASVVPSWQYLADELHSEAQMDRADRDSFFQFNPATHNVFVPCTGVAAASDTHVRAVCFLACRALKRAVELQGSTPLPSSQPLSLVIETGVDSQSSGASVPVSESARDRVRRFALSQPLPVNWLYLLERSAHALDTSPSDPHTPAAQTERLIAALQHVFREMRWHPCESAALTRADDSNSAAADAAPAPSLPAHDHVFTFNIADNIA